MILGCIKKMQENISGAEFDVETLKINCRPEPNQTKQSIELGYIWSFKLLLPN
jgi:hypothetical protein